MVGGKGVPFCTYFSSNFIFRWDTRKLNDPLERLLMDPVKTDEQDISRSYGISVLEYETTMPTKFMCGTDMGMIFVCNRKGKTPTEKINIRVGDFIYRINGISLCILYRFHSDDDPPWSGVCDHAKSKLFEELSNGRRLDGTHLVGGLS